MYDVRLPLLVSGRVAQTLALFTLLGLAGCGAGWAAVFGTSSSSSGGSSTTAFAVNSEGIGDLANAEPVEEFLVTFSVPVKASSATPNAVTVVIEGGDPVVDELVSTVDVIDPAGTGVGNVVRVRLRQPLRLLGKYEMEVVAGVLEDQSGRLFPGTQWTVQVRDGILGEEQLVSFFDRFASFHILDNLSTAGAILSQDAGGNQVLSVTTAPKGSGFTFPVTVRTTTEDNLLVSHMSADATGSLLVAWQENSVSAGCRDGKLFSSISTGPANTAFTTPVAIDAALGLNNQGDTVAYQSWPARVRRLDSGEDVAVWFAWRDENNSNEGSNYGRYEQFAIYYSIGIGGSWSTPLQLDVSSANRYPSWPTLLTTDDEGLYVTWGTAPSQNDVFDAQGNDSLDAYFVSRYDPNTLTFTAPAQVNAGAALPRLASVAGNGETTQNRRAVLARPAPGATTGPRAFVFDIDTGAFQETFTSSWPGTFATDASIQSSVPSNCTQSSFAAQGPKFPRAIGPITLSNGNSGALVFWFDDASELLMQELDLDQGFLGNAQVIVDAQASSGFAPSPNTMKLFSDLEETVTALWFVSNSATPVESRLAALRGRRDDTGTFAWKTVGCQVGGTPAPCSEIAAETLIISDPGASGLPRCAINSIVDCHDPTGRIVIGWTDTDCMGSQLAALTRFFR